MLELYRKADVKENVQSIEEEMYSRHNLIVCKERRQKLE